MFGPGYTEWDTAVSKQFPLGERVRLRFRAEFFNALNKPSFGNPVGDLSSPSVGEVTRTTGLAQKHTSKAVRQLAQGLIVSCQVAADSPLNDSKVIALMAQVAEKHGAKGVRIDGTVNIKAVRKRVSLPIIGIEKVNSDGVFVRITPDLASARRVWRAGSDIIAMDFTERPRPGGQSLADIVRWLKKESPVPIMADVATLKQGRLAEELGADLVATTLHGYTDPRQRVNGPAFRLLSQLAAALSIPVILEGRVHSAEQVQRAFDLGAYAVVVGTAITNMDYLIQQFVSATNHRRK